ncbi:MAG: hypothetical protein EON98_13765 [Chitinophagaceae bacterium]|nr:MAG: hypothetical protein EON98_13765 [Chitinophagaceae bacterium]
MKPYCVIFLLLFTNYTWSQSTSFRDQLQRITSDVPNHFRSLRGEIKKVTNQDTIFHSQLIIEGTQETEISSPSYVVVDGDTVRSQGAFIATIAADLTESEAKPMLNKWRKDVKWALSKEWKQKTYLEEWGIAGSAQGYTFSNGLAAVVVWRSIPSRSKDHNYVYITIASH